jgi:hypothetical protein
MVSTEDLKGQAQELIDRGKSQKLSRREINDLNDKLRTIRNREGTTYAEMPNVRQSESGLVGKF